MNLSFLRRWALGSVAAGIVFVVGWGIQFSSLYGAFMLVLIIGLLNAALPYFISMMSFIQSVATLGLATLVANTLVLYCMQSAGLGVRFASTDALFMIAVMISTLVWFASIATDVPAQNSKRTDHFLRTPHHPTKPTIHN